MSELTFTPLPAHIHKPSHVKRIFFFSLIPLFILGIGVYAYFQYQSYLTNLEGSIGSISDESPPTVTPVATLSATLAPYAGNKTIPSDWKLEKSKNCAVSMPIPPAEEPYIIPRDPNTPPNALEDEGKYWIFEELDAQLFTFNQMARAIFKNPEKPGAGFVSAAVEIYCAVNDGKYTTASLMKKIENDLVENISVISVKETIDDTQWGFPVKVVRFQGGTFGNEQYFILATSTHLYMIKSFGESSNPDIVSVQDEIFGKLRFE
ncbi:hypothetical protein KBD81_01785 [Candidatus Woesebacteria bacterium]|nr:hypothetical protein [Candidatus Woesebacteria bacterium]